MRESTPTPEAISAASPTSRDVHAEAMRDRIRGAAVELFGLQGYGSTGLREIADLASINVASIYHYFPSKEDLLVSIIEGLYAETYRPAREILERASGPGAALVGLTRHHVALHCREAAAATISDRELGVLRSGVRARVLELRDGYERLWADLLRHGSEVGAFRIDDLEVARLSILGMCSQVAAWYCPGGRLTISEIATAYARNVVRIVGYRPPAAASGEAQRTFNGSRSEGDQTVGTLASR